MEKIEEGGNTKEKMDPDMDSSSKHVEEFQAEKHHKDPNVEQNLMDPNSKRIVSNHSAKRSRKKETAEFIKKLEAQAKILQDEVAILKPILESQKKQMRDLMGKEQALIQETKYLLEKALLRDAENEKNRNTMNRLRELEKMKQEELVMFNIDPLDPEFNDAPSIQDGGSGSQSS
ncbi:hypothetical protein VNO80_29961 [Phaseolus coccineus]|uniref:Uncharacterized protein n=1 Tax=Phaseolus coccineus TaxID=3886 RepID=A0AAN9LCD1_PHACN